MHDIETSDGLTWRHMPARVSSDSPAQWCADGDGMVAVVHLPHGDARRAPGMYLRTDARGFVRRLPDAPAAACAAAATYMRRADRHLWNYLRGV